MAAGYADLSSVASISIRMRSSKLVTDLEPEHPRPRNGLLQRKLRGRRECALEDIGEVLPIQFRRPRILADADRGIVLGDWRVLESQVVRGDRGADQARVATGLREGMRGVCHARLREQIVGAHHPLIA